MAVFTLKFPSSAGAQIFIANNPNNTGHFQIATIEQFSHTGDRSVLKSYSPSGFTTVANLAFDSAGNLYAEVNEDIIKISPDGQSSVIVPKFGDYQWSDLAHAASGGVYATAYSISKNNVSILKIESDGTIIEKVSGLNRNLAGNSRLAVDSVGNLYVTSPSEDAVFRFDDTGAMTKIADINGAYAVAVDGMDNIYVSGQVDSISGGYAIMKITGTTVEDFVVAPSDDFRPVSLAVDAENNVFASSFPNSVKGAIYRFDSEGEGGVFYRWEGISGPGDIAILNLAPIPEPSTYAMILGAMVLIAAGFRRR